MYKLCSSFVFSAYLFARAFRLNLFMRAVTLISFLQLDNFVRLIASSAFDIVTWQTILVSRRLQLSSCRSSTGAVVCCGQSYSGNLRNSGPCFYLSFNSCAVAPRERSSATFCPPATCFHWEGLELFGISPTRADTKGL